MIRRVNENKMKSNDAGKIESGAGKAQPGGAARTVVLAVLAAYLTVLLYLLFFRTPFDGLVSRASLLKPVPFETIISQLHAWRSNRGVLVRYGATNLIGNLVLFAPMGFLLPCAFKRLRRAYLTLPAVMAAVVLAELIQLFAKLGFADVDDLILNTAGAAMGYFAFWLAKISCREG